MNQTEFEDDPVSLPAAAASAAAQAMAAMFARVGIVSFRAAEVDLDSMDVQSSWNLNSQLEVQPEESRNGADSAFIAANDAGLALRDAPADFTLVRKLSPRIWAFAWRTSAERMVVAEARYRDRREAVSETDNALIRLIFLNGTRAGEADEVLTDSRSPQLEWPAVDRRRDRSRLGAARSHRLSLMLLVISAAAALFVAAFAAPAASDQAAAAQSDALRFQTMAERTMTQALSLALASGDYGEVQEELSSFLALGYFQRALVVNARQRVVASAGPFDGAVIGSSLTVAMSGETTPTLLLRGSEQVGQLLSFGKPATAQVSGGFQALKVASLLAFLTAVAAAVVLMSLQGWRLRSRG